MKSINLSTLLALGATVSSLALLAACGGGGGHGGGGGGYVDVTTGDVTTVTTVIINSGDSGSYSGDAGSYSGDGGYASGDGGYYSGDGGYTSGGGCDASGCNSFGVGGSKNTGLLASKMTEAQMKNKATAVSSQFQMSYDSAYKLTQLASQVQQMKQQGQMTDKDKAAVTESAFAVAGVTSDEVNNAIAKSLNGGDQSAVEDVMAKAAQNMGMPSGATFRDKVLPLFSGNSPAAK